MGTKLFLIVLVILMQDSLDTLAERDYYPRLRKVIRKDWRSPSTSVEGESRVLFLLDKTTRRPNKANIIYVTVPTGTGTSGEDVDPPSTPTWPPHTTAAPSPDPEPPKGHYPTYSHVFPFIPPLLLPVPGWTGNPPPPYIPPSHAYKPYKPKPLGPELVGVPVGSMSAPGTPTTTTTDDESGWSPYTDDSFVSDDLLSIPTGPGGDLLDIRKPRPSKKPRPTRKPTTTTLKPNKQTEDDLSANRKKKPRPSRKPRPSKKPMQSTVKPDAQEEDIEDESAPATDKPVLLDVTTLDSSIESETDETLTNRKKKPKPSRKPRPSKKPTSTTEKPTPDIEESSYSVEEPDRIEPEEDSLMLDEIADEGSGEIDDELLVNRKKKPKPSKKPRPSKKPQPVVEEPDKTELNNESSIAAEDDSLTNRKKKPRPSRKPRPSKKPEVVTEDADSDESLGPDRDLIVIQREGKPMRIRLAQRRRIPPWKLLKLPTDMEWQRSLPRTRPNFFVMA